MTSHTPLVSILIPCYNAERWIRQAIESALAQTWPNKQVIVVDDGSTDGSLDVIRSFGDAIQFEAGPNRGANLTRNRLFELSRGEWLQYLDADDYLLEDKISGQLAKAPDRNRADVIYSPITLEAWQDDQAADRQTMPIPAPRDPWVLLARWMMPGTHAVLIRCDALSAVGGWKPDQPVCQEHELFLRMLMAGAKFHYSPHHGAIYRQWNNETLCKKNPSRTMEHRLQIVHRLATYLKQSDQWTPPRRQAVTHGMLECARSLYPYHPDAAKQTVADALELVPDLQLHPAECFPWGYRKMFHLMGFTAAESLASRIRLPRVAIQNWFNLLNHPVRSPQLPIDVKAAIASAERMPSQLLPGTPADRVLPVSILIPCHNSERWIGQAIRSALEQTWPNKEVIVVDDGSTDGSLEIIRSFGDSIRVESGPNRGGNVARNRLLELSRGKWLQYLDADDYLLPEKVERQMLQMSDRSVVDVAYSPVVAEEWYGDEISHQHVTSVPTQPISEHPWSRLVCWELPQTGAALWRRSAVMDVGGWKANQPCCQEHELYFRLLMAGKRFEYCPTPGAVYRQWSSGTVSRKNPYQTLIHRLEIIAAAERFLIERNELYEIRQRAISLARLQCARNLYQHDRAMARHVATLSRQVEPSFEITPLPCFPSHYRWFYKRFGFHSAEIAASLFRRCRIGTTL